MLIEDPEAERKHLLDMLVGQLTEFVVVIADVERRFVSWHPGVQLTFGYEASEFIGMPAKMLFPEPDRSAGDSEREFAAAAATGKSSDTRWLVSKSGERILVEGVTVGLHDESGNLA